MTDRSGRISYLALASTRLIGPMLDKELRVASRQRKYYLLRFAYVCLLTLVTLQAWWVLTRAGGGASQVVQVSRLSTAGRTVIATIVWFQFVTGQILAAVLLSDAISSEIRRRTLEGLLVTPLRATRIVLEKLLSRLLQLVLLLAISLPVLAVARVFGGVPWDYVVAGLCITLSGSIFAGSLSLSCSITSRHAYQAVLAVGLWYIVVWGVLAWAAMLLPLTGFPYSASVVRVLSVTNPFWAMLAQTQAMIGGSTRASVSVPVLWHCLTILGLAGVILALSVWRMRRVALVYQGGSSRPARPWYRRGVTRHRAASEAIRRVQGAPVVWKELGTPLSLARRQAVAYGLLWVVVTAFIIAILGFSGPESHGAFFVPILILQWFFVIRLGVAAASTITREKEAHAWPILLATPLSDKEILQGKLIAVFRKNLPLLIPLAVLYLFAALAGSTEQPGSLLLILSVGAGLVGSVVFLLGVGVYLSTRLKTTAGAIGATLGVYLAPKLFCCGLPGPLMLLAPGHTAGPFAGVFLVALLPPVVHVIVGLLCLRGALGRLRRNVF